jgi:hypothetical protein
LRVHWCNALRNALRDALSAKRMQAAWPARASVPAERRAAAQLRPCAVGAPARRLAASRLPRAGASRGSADRGSASASDSARVRAVGSDLLGAAGSGTDAAPPRRRGQPRKDAVSEAAQAEPQKRRQRVQFAGERGEKTADGKPKPDERTVADLVRRGWFKTEEAVLLVLGRLSKTNKTRYPFETAKPAADWLEATLGRVPLKGGVLPAAKAVKAFPELLQLDAATLQRKWDALTLSAEQGGVGVAFSKEQACEAVLKHPQVLAYTTDNLKRGWSMLKATEGGLGLSPDEARSCILRSPAVLRFDHDNVVRRVELLKSLGYPKAHEMVLNQPRVLTFAEESVREHAAWWKQTGLEHLKVVTQQANLLGVSTTDLQSKLDFLCHVVGMSTTDLNNAGQLFTFSLDGRLRARYFYALQEGKLADFTSMSTMLAETDATFLAMLQGLSNKEARANKASDREVERYQEHVVSAKFVAWREEQEAQRMAVAP